MREIRLFSVGILAFLAGCTWPPKPSVPNAPSQSQAPQQAPQQVDTLPQAQMPQTMTAPRLSTSGGGLLRR